MIIYKDGKNYYIERCKDNEGIIFFLYRYSTIQKNRLDSTAIAESRVEQKIILAFNALENIYK